MSLRLSLLSSVLFFGLATVPAQANHHNWTCDAPRLKTGQTVEGPIQTTGTHLAPASLIPGLTSYCTVRASRGQSFGRLHEKGAFRGIPIRVDHDRNGVSIALGDKAESDFATFSQTAAFAVPDNVSIACSTNAMNVICRVYPLLKLGKDNPFTLSFSQNGTAPARIDGAFNPTVIGASIDDLDRTAPLRLRLSNGETIMIPFTPPNDMDFLSPSPSLDFTPDGAVQLSRAIQGGNAFTLTVTRKDGGLSTVEVNNEDAIHASGTLQFVQPMVGTLLRIAASREGV